MATLTCFFWLFLDNYRGLFLLDAFWSAFGSCELRRALVFFGYLKLHLWFLSWSLSSLSFRFGLVSLSGNFPWLRTLSCFSVGYEISIGNCSFHWFFEGIDHVIGRLMDGGVVMAAIFSIVGFINFIDCKVSLVQSIIEVLVYWGFVGKLLRIWSSLAFCLLVIDEIISVCR